MHSTVGDPGLGCTKYTILGVRESGSKWTVMDDSGGFSRKTGRSWIKLDGRLYKSNFHR